MWVRGANASCSRVTAVFANGQRAQLRAPSTKIFRGQIYQMDLPGGYQNVNGVEMVCRAGGSSDVTINVLARNNL